MLIKMSQILSSQKAEILDDSDARSIQSIKEKKTRSNIVIARKLSEFGGQENMELKFSPFGVKNFQKQ